MKTKRPRLPLPENSAYEVGYAKPPKASQFKKGTSGNPRGRPKGSRNKPSVLEERFKAIVLKEAYRVIDINDAAGNIRMPMAQAVFRSMAVKAAKGNTQAQKQFAELVSTVEGDNRRRSEEILTSAFEYIHHWEQKLENRKRTGTTGADPLPHPDHVIIDPMTGEVHIRGPITREEKVIWDFVCQKKTECDQEIAECEELLRNCPDRKEQRALRAKIKHAKVRRAIFAKRIPD